MGLIVVGWVLFVGLVVGMHASAWAAEREAVMPDLASVLGEGYQVPPELTDRAQPGSVIRWSDKRIDEFKSDCLRVVAKEHEVTSLTTSSSLAGGVRMSVGGMGVETEGLASMELQFSEPYILTYEEAHHSKIKPACMKALEAELERGGLNGLMLVTEAMFAKVSGCKKLEASAKAGIFGRGAQAKRGQAGCLDKTKRDKPVIVGLRMRAVLDLFPKLDAAAERLGKAGQAGTVGFAAGRPNSVGMTLVRINPGRFDMGCTADPEGEDECEADELPIRRIGIRQAFLMQTTEVTQKQWRMVVENEEEPPLHLNPSENTWCGSECPVDNVSWNDAVVFANLLSSQEGLRPAYKITGSRVKWDRTSNGYRLPTEAEWEYAARAGQGTVYSGANEPYGAGWYEGNSDGPQATGGMEPNYWGLHDMTGSLWEWCWDWYGKYEGDVDDPTGPKYGRNRVLRGGSWCHGAHYARNSSRNYGPSLSSGRGPCRGFRLVRSTR